MEKRPQINTRDHENIKKNTDPDQKNLVTSVEEIEVMEAEIVNDEVAVYEEEEPKYKAEILAIAKEARLTHTDERINRKREVNACAVSTINTQSQNQQLINACQEKLKDENISEEEAREAFNLMAEAVKSTRESDRTCKETIQEIEADKRKSRWFWGGTAVTVATVIAVSLIRRRSA